MVKNLGNSAIRNRLATTLVLAFSVSVSVSFSVSAYEIAPEYHSIPTERGFELMNPAQVDSEYESALLTYGTPPTYTVAQPKETGRIFLSAGSLSATQFDYRLSGEVATDLAPAVHFKFLRVEDENYEERLQSSVVELQFGRGPLRVAAYGALAGMKRADDVGFALIHRIADDRAAGEARLFVTLADFTRNDRNDDPDRFEKGSEPVVYGFLSRGRNGEVFIRRETPVRWNDPRLDQQYSYEQTAIGGTAIKDQGAIRFFFDRKETSLRTNSSGAIRSVLRDRHEVEFRKGLVIEGSMLEWGLAYVARLWHDQVSRRLTHENLTPFLWIRGHNGVELGLESTRFRAFGDPALASPTIKWEAQETRLNTRYRIRFENRGELALTLTFDLDNSDGNLFDGGQGQFLVDF